VIVSHQPRASIQHGTISLARETPLFLVSPFLSVSSALFSAMAPTHHQSFQPLTHSYHRDGGCTPLDFFLALRSLFSLFDPRVFHNSFAINSFRTLSKKCRVYGGPSHRFLKYYFNFSNNSQWIFSNRRISGPLLPSTSALFHFPYPATPLFATLTKTPGVYTISSHSGKKLDATKKQWEKEVHQNQRFV
jgi:hypothetical protein